MSGRLPLRLDPEDEKHDPIALRGDRRPDIATNITAPGERPAD
jgi:hypothetical protein